MKLKSTLLLSLALFMGCATDQQPEPYAQTLPTRSLKDLHISKVEKVYDGGTIVVDLEGLPPIFGDDIGVRIAGIDTPEIRTTNSQEKARGLRAKEFLKSKIDAAKTIELKNVRRDKYFRILADVMIDGQSAAEMMLKAGYAKAYNGGTKEEW